MSVVPLGLAATGGLIVGSFLNVVIHRVPRGESVIRPASHCPHCGGKIRLSHNIPIVSWLALRANSACCQRPISPRYPIVEALTALLFCAMVARLGGTPELAAYLYLAAIAVALTAIDLAVKRLPDAIVLPSYLVAGVLLAAASAAGSGHTGWGAMGRAGLASAALFAGFFVLAFAYPAGMGFGDVKLAGLLGLYLGWLGWSQVAVGVLSAFLLGALVGVALLVTGRATGKTALPFGPYLLAGTLFALFATEPVVTSYLSLLTAT